MKQSSIDVRFTRNLTGDPSWLCGTTADVAKIKEVVKARHGIQLSSAEAAYFWVWRSGIWEAGWLMLDSGAEVEIAEWFERFYAEHASEYDDYEV